MQSKLFVCMLAAAALMGQDRKFPALKPQPNAAAVIKEHLSAINACDWNRLMAQYPLDVEIFYPDGVHAKGREAVGKKFAEAVAPFAQGGLCGLTFTVEQTQVVGDTLNVQWRADAPFLAKPYHGADAYETRNGLMQAQVTTFKNEDLKKK